jgi:hypothetical protein
MNKTFFAVALIVVIGFSSTTGAAYALNETERYNSGYSYGYMDAKNGIDNFPTYLNQFQTMVSKFHVNA